MVALAGTVQGNIVILEDDSISNYDGESVIITILNRNQKKKRQPINWESFGIETERGKNVEKYMEEIRGNDRV